MDLENLVGLTIDGKYRLERKIGEGGMGSVYLGVQLMVKRSVAVKVLHMGLNTAELPRQRFEVEAKAVGRLNHPNCVTLHDFGYSSELDALFMVMELVDGEAMHRRVVRGVRLLEALDIARQIGLALDHAHHQGILHRDLKPENIMITRTTDGSELIKVLDFGIARIFRANEFDTQNPDQNRLTRAGEVFGTPAYLSPEQARGERDLTPASDLYSLGVMLFEMVEGQLPFWGDTALDTIMLHVAQPVPELTRLEAPQQLKALITSMMDKVAAKRPQTGREVAQALEHISAKIRAEPPSYPLALQPIEAEVSPPFKTLAHPPWPSASSLADPPGSTPSLDTNAEVERLPEGTTDSLSTLEELHDLDAPTAYAPRTLVALLLMPLALGAFVFVLFTQGDTSDDVSVEAKARAIGAEQSEALLQAEVTAAQTSPPNEDATQAQKSLPLAHEASANAEVTEQSAAPPEEAPRRPKKHPKTKRRGRDTLRRTKMDSELKEGDESAPKPPYRGPTRLTL